MMIVIIRGIIFFYLLFVDYWFDCWKVDDCFKMVNKIFVKIGNNDEM